MQTKYIGTELELFKNAINWKKYFSKKIRPHIRGKVLEVGAGIGATTKFIYNDSVEKWVCLEPDEKLSENISNDVRNKNLSQNTSIICGTLDDLKIDDFYDTIIYVDVIEHIQDDKNELQKCERHLKPGGKLIVLVPAFQILYSDFDKIIGHYRRYNKVSLLKVIPTNVKLIKLFYLDSLGYMLSLSNKLFFKKKFPTINNIILWDKVLVKLSKITDFVVKYSFGKSLIGIWVKND